MFLDRFELDTLTVQLQYSSAYEIWDNAGSIAKDLARLWPELEVIEGQPFQQTLRAKGIQIQSGIKASTIILSNVKSLNAKTIEQITNTFRIWRTALALDRLSRISTRALYISPYDSVREATAALVNLGLIRWPRGKMFDQPEDGERNAVEVAYKYEDEKSFSFLILRSEQVKYEVKLDPPFDKEELKKVVSRVVVDFDRGLLGSVAAATFQMDEWLKGFQHVLRRDIDKITTNAS